MSSTSILTVWARASSFLMNSGGSQSRIRKSRRRHGRDRNYDLRKGFCPWRIQKNAVAEHTRRCDGSNTFGFGHHLLCFTSGITSASAGKGGVVKATDGKIDLCGYAVKNRFIDCSYRTYSYSYSYSYSYYFHFIEHHQKGSRRQSGKLTTPLVGRG